MLLDLQADKRSVGLGSDVNHSILRANVERYFSISDRTTLGLRTAGMGSRGTLPVCEKAYLGGYGYPDSPSLRLVGFARDELTADRFVLAGANVRYQVLSRPMSFARRGFLTLEYNLTEISEPARVPSGSRMIQGAAVGFSLDTMIGPVRFATGIGESGKLRIYFALGPSF
jgi:outer membrane protein assembly factor BamA